MHVYTVSHAVSSCIAIIALSFLGHQFTKFGYCIKYVMIISHGSIMCKFNNEIMEAIQLFARLASSNIIVL